MAEPWSLGTTLGLRSPATPKCRGPGRTVGGQARSGAISFAKRAEFLPAIVGFALTELRNAGLPAKGEVEKERVSGMPRTAWLVSVAAALLSGLPWPSPVGAHEAAL